MTEFEKMKLRVIIVDQLVSNENRTSRGYEATLEGMMDYIINTALDETEKFLLKNKEAN